MMRKRTFMDKKFSAGDANSKAFVDNWEATFGDKKAEEEPVLTCLDCGAEHPHFCEVIYTRE